MFLVFPENLVSSQVVHRLEDVMNITIKRTAHFRCPSCKGQAVTEAAILIDKDEILFVGKCMNTDCSYTDLIPFSLNALMAVLYDATVKERNGRVQ